MPCPGLRPRQAYHEGQGGFYSIGHVMKKMAQGLRFIWHDPDCRLPKDSAITYRRYQLGARPLVALFRRVCRPMATPETPGAFLFGLRLMAIDGTPEDVPDTPENAAVFGRHHSDRGQSAFPQVQGVYLVECGPHAIVDAGFWPCHTSERVGGWVSGIRLDLLRQGLACNHSKTAGTCRDTLRVKREQALWTFVRVQGVEPTNANPAGGADNLGERQARPGVLWRKNSFGTRSKAGSRFAERIMTVVATLKQQLS